jgi:hypothetical protein
MSEDSGLAAATAPLGATASALVRDYLDRHGKQAEQLASGVVVAPLGGPDLDAPWQLWLAAAGSQRDWLVAQVRAGHRVPRERWPNAIAACNTWNASSAFSKAWLAVEDWESALDGGLVLEASMPLDGGAGQDVVDGFLDAMRRDAVAFWRAMLRT